MATLTANCFFRVERWVLYHLYSISCVHFVQCVVQGHKYLTVRSYHRLLLSLLPSTVLHMRWILVWIAWETQGWRLYWSTIVYVYFKQANFMTGLFVSLSLQSSKHMCIYIFLYSFTISAQQLHKRMNVQDLSQNQNMFGKRLTN